MTSARCRSTLKRIRDRAHTWPHRRLLRLIAEQNDAALAKHFSQIEATMALHSTLRFRLPLPPMRGWAVSPDFACDLVREILLRNPKNVLELGSGVSTLVTGYALESIGGGRVVSLDHHAEWCALTAERIVEHGLGGVAEVIHAPLTDVAIGNKVYRWYDISRLSRENKFDLLVVDGPPGQLFPMARYPALPMLVDLLAPGAVVMLHDSDRPDETVIVQRWQQEYGPFAIESPQSEKGTKILRRGSVANP